MLDGGDREVRIERVVTYQDAVFSEVRPNGGEWSITAHESNARGISVSPRGKRCKMGSWATTFTTGEYPPGKRDW